MLVKGIIRKISVGDVKEGITYKVGQPQLGGQLTIAAIERDVDDETVNRIEVYVYSRGSNHARLWKSFEDMPIAIEFDISEYEAPE
jgi:hypothetical protein